MARDHVTRSQFSVMWRRVFWYTGIFGRSQWPSGLRRGSAAGRLLGCWVRIPPGTWKFASSECCMLSGSGRCVGLITRPEESYRIRCVWVWSWSPVRGGHDHASGRSATEKKKYRNIWGKPSCPFVQSEILSWREISVLESIQMRKRHINS